MTSTRPEVAASERLFVKGGVNPPWRIVLASMFAMAFGPSVILAVSFGVFSPALARAFGWGVGETSLGATFIALAIMILSPIQGLLVDRFGSRAIVLVCLPLFAAGVAGFTLMNGDIRVFYAACFIVPLLGIGVWPLSYLKLTSTWFDRRLGLALGLTNVGVGVGAAVMPVIIGIAFKAAGWQAAYLTLAAIILFVVWPVCAIFLRENPSRPSAARLREAAAAAPGLTLPEILRTSSFWLLTVAFIILGVISSGILIHQVGILTAHGLSYEAAIGLQSVLGLASIVGRVGAGWLLDRFRVSSLMALVLVAAAAAAGLYASDITGPSLVLAAVIFGLVIGAEFDALGVAIRRYFGLRAFGTVFGLTFAAFQLGASVGIAAIGVSLTRTGSYSLGMSVLVGLSLLCALIFLCLRAYRYGPDGQLAVPPAPVPVHPSSEATS